MAMLSLTPKRLFRDDFTIEFTCFNFNFSTFKGNLANGILSRPVCRSKVRHGSWSKFLSLFAGVEQRVGERLDDGVSTCRSHSSGRSNSGELGSILERADVVGNNLGENNREKRFSFVTGEDITYLYSLRFAIKYKFLP